MASSAELARRELRKRQAVREAVADEKVRKREEVARKATAKREQLAAAAVTRRDQDAQAKLLTQLERSQTLLANVTATLQAGQAAQGDAMAALGQTLHATLQSMPTASVTATAPPPVKFTVNRDSTGLISTVDAVPQAGA